MVHHIPLFLSETYAITMGVLKHCFAYSQTNLVPLEFDQVQKIKSNLIDKISILNSLVHSQGVVDALQAR